MASKPENNNTISIDITIGAVVISVGAIIYIGRLLYIRRRRKRKDLEKVLEPVVELEEIDIKPSPKKTAADHLGELKEVTQKVLQPLRKSSSYSSPKENLSSNFSSGRNSTSSSKTNLYDPFTFKLFKVPPPPPPTPLRSDDIKVDPLRISLLNFLLIDESENTDLTAPSESSSRKNLSRNMSQPNLNLTYSKKDLRRKISQSDLNLTYLSRKVSQPDLNSNKDLSRKISQPDLNSKKDLPRKISQPDLNLTSSKKDLPRKISQPDLNLTSSRKDLSRKISQPDLNLTNSKKDLSRKISQSDLNLMNSKEELPRISWSPLHPPKKDLLPQLDSSETRSRNVLSTVPTVPQLDSIIPSETRLKREITRTKQSNSKVRSRRSHRRKNSRKKETNDYTNFQPIQNIKPIRNAQSENRIMPAKITKIVETKEVGELTLPPMYSKDSKVKPVLKENQDDEIILDANK